MIGEIKFSMANSLVEGIERISVERKGRGGEIKAWRRCQGHEDARGSTYGKEAMPGVIM